jgi:Reverse transcriptase (RNA-dependent DNA polymerase)
MESNQVLALDKALYGLVEAARMWMKTLVEHLTIKMHIQRSRGEPCFYWKYEKTDFIGVLIYVDDCAIFGNKDNVEKFQSELSEQFSVKK